eukprot:3109989-Lingulodinium_polyedra.AAC.1
MVRSLAERAFPPALLAMIVPIHWGIRVLVADGESSKFLTVTRSCVPGCCWAGELARTYIYDVMHQMSIMIPSPMPEAYADDISTYIESTAQRAVNGMKNAAVALVEGLQAKGLV